MIFFRQVPVYNARFGASGAESANLKGSGGMPSLCQAAKTSDDNRIVGCRISDNQKLKIKN